MPRARDPNRDKAYEIYKQHEGDIDLVEIASQLNFPPGTIRGWKSKDKWSNKLNGTLQTNTERSIKEKNAKKKRIADEVKQVMDNPELNDKQRLFCLNYIKCFNATKAYQKVYECSYETAMANGSDLLRNTKVREQIQLLKQGKLNQSFLEPGDIFQKYMDIAFSDITDFMIFNNEMATTEDNKEVMISRVNLKNDCEVDGTIINEVSKGKDGVKIKLNDRMKALQWLTDHMNLATERQKAEIALINKKADIGTTHDTSLMQSLIDLVGDNE
jgi:phage terminase small subunit